MLETSDMQGLILSGYGKQPSAIYLFLSIIDPAKSVSWLAQVTPLVTSGDNSGRNRKISLNLAFTHQGLGRLGLSAATRSTFSRPFVEGMAQPDRARLLGDSIDTWQWGKPGHAIDAVLMLFATDPQSLAAQLAIERQRVQGVLEELFAIESEDLPARPGHLPSEEHFGFVDGIAQPSIAGYRPEKSAGNGPGNDVKAGEFVLGYENEYGQNTDSPIVKPPDADPGSILAAGDFGRNGTYLVLRQLEQDVAGFWGMLEQQCRRRDGAVDRQAEEALAAIIVGRWRDGTPVTVSPEHGGGDPKKHNDFGFSDDQFGQRCPFGAHIRRANPRDTLLEDAGKSIMTVKRHRLLRRGRPYGRPILDRYRPDGQSRGLLFATLNANIERQFEFVQHAWITSPNFAGLYDEADPLLGGRTQTAGVFTIPRNPVRERRNGILPHISVKGGEYFFLPSLRALRYLSK